MRATCKLQTKSSLSSSSSCSSRASGIHPLFRYFRHPPPARKRPKVEPKSDEERASRGLPLREPWFEVKPTNEKQKNFVLRMKDVLQKPKSRKMEVADLGRLREELDVLKKGKQKKISVYVRRFPTAFDLETYYTHNNRKKTWCSFTAEARDLLQEEAKIFKESEAQFVDKLQKLLMISIKKRLPFGTLKDVRPLLGLPVDFKERLLNKYPDLFLFKERKGYLYVELKAWDEKLSISAVERHLKKGNPIAVSKDKGNSCSRRGVTNSGHESEGESTISIEDERGDPTTKLSRNGSIVNSDFEIEGEDLSTIEDEQGDTITKLRRTLVTSLLESEGEDICTAGYEQGDPTTEDEQGEATKVDGQGDSPTEDEGVHPTTEDEEGDTTTEDEGVHATIEDEEGDTTTEGEGGDSAVEVEQGYISTQDEQEDLSEESHCSYLENPQDVSAVYDSKSDVTMPIGPSICSMQAWASEEETLASDHTSQSSLPVEEQQQIQEVSIVEAASGQQQTLDSPKFETGACKRILSIERRKFQVGEDRNHCHHKREGVQEREFDVGEHDDSTYLHFPWKTKREPSIRRSEQIIAFQSAPYVSPYKNSRDLELPHHRWAADKFAVGVIHEFLSLTLEKRATLEQLEKLRRPYGLPKHLQGFLLRFDGIFYVAKAATKSGVTKSHVFLKEAYRHSVLIEKHPLVVWQERFAELAFKSKELMKRKAKKQESHD